MKEKIYEYQGKNYIRQGECLRCGMCCTGYGSGPCPQLQWDDADHCTCLIYDKDCGNDFGGLCGEFHLFPNNPEAQAHPSIKNKCGYYFVPIQKVLLAAPTYSGKDYCLDKYLKGIHSLDYPVDEFLLVDNSEGSEYTNKLRGLGIKTIHLDIPRLDSNLRIGQADEFIRKYFLDGPWDWWFLVEADVIIPPETLTQMLSLANNADYVCLSPRHATWREPNEEFSSSFGCSLFSRKIMEGTSWVEMLEGTSPDSYWWNYQVKTQKRRFKTIELWDYLDVRHV